MLISQPEIMLTLTVNEISKNLLDTWKIVMNHYQNKCISQVLYNPYTVENQSVQVEAKESRSHS